MTLEGSSHINSPHAEPELPKEPQSFNVKINLRTKKKGKVNIHELPSILQSGRQSKNRNSTLQSRLLKGSTDLSYAQVTERSRINSKLDILALESEFGRLMSNRDIEGSVIAYRNAEKSQFESLFEQKMLNI
jgi:hypothetical protein